MANSLVRGEKKQTFSVFLTQDAIKKKINEVIGGKGGGDGCTWSDPAPAGELEPLL